MYQQYRKELNKLLKESIDKDRHWHGWCKIEILQDIISKYVLFQKTS
jgi:hypothetical protein